MTNQLCMYFMVKKQQKLRAIKTPCFHLHKNNRKIGNLNFCAKIGQKCLFFAMFCYWFFRQNQDFGMKIKGKGLIMTFIGLMGEHRPDLLIQIPPLWLLQESKVQVQKLHLSVFFSETHLGRGQVKNVNSCWTLKVMKRNQYGSK